MLYALLMSTACADSASCVVPGAREAQLARFRKWFKSGPGVTHDIALRTVEEGASDDTACVHAEFSVARETNWSAPASAQHPFGVFALKPVRRETKILSVAVKWIVCRRTALLSGGRALRKAVRKLRSEDEVMLLLLLHERALGSVSRWAPYFAMLPSVDDVVAPIAFDNASIALLHSPVFAAETRSYIALLKSRRARIAPLLNATLHDAIAKRAEKRGKKARPGEGGDVVDTMRRGAVEAQSDAAWTWAAHVLDSRALSYRGERLLVPLVDFFRYKPIGRGGEAQDWEQYHRLERSAFSLHADRDFALGEELKEDYGCMPSAQYFRNGFVPRVNPCNCARLLWSPLLIMLRAGVSDEARDEPRTAALRALSAEAGLSVSPKYLTMSPEYEIMCVNPEAHLVRGAPHPPQDPVLALLALDTMSLAEANACRADVAASRAAGGDACTLVLATGRKGCADAGACERGRSVAYARMLAMLRSQLNAFEAQSAVDEDECMLRNPVARLTLRPNDILAVQFRISEKRVLARAIDALRARAPGIDAAAAEAARQEGGDGDAVRGASWCDANAFNSWFGRKFDLAEGHFFRRGIAAALPEGAAPCPAGLVVHAAPTALDDSKSYGLFSIAHRGVNASEPYLCVPINFAVSLKQFYAAIPRAVELGLRESTLANLRPGGELVMDRASAQSCDVLGPLFRKMQRLYKRSDAMHELLLHLMHERFGRAERSEWWPYLRLLPAAPPVRTRSAGWGREFDEQALPFFDTCASARLGTVSPGTRRILQRHRDAVDRAFNGIESNVFALDRALFPSEVYTLGRYRWARAILESRWCVALRAACCPHARRRGARRAAERRRATCARALLTPLPPPPPSSYRLVFGGTESVIWCRC